MSDLAHSIRRKRDALTQEQQTHREFCRSIILPDGPFKGQPYEPSIHPAQNEIINALDEGRRKIVLAKPVQDGGSLTTAVPLFKRAVRESQAVILAYPTMDAAKDAWSDKIWPVLESYGGQEPKRGGGSRGGAARVVRLPGGGRFVLRQAGGRKESGQASITADAGVIEEVDDWPNRHRISLVEKRVSRSRSPLLLYVSTVKMAIGSLIIEFWGDSDVTMSVLAYPCARCAGFRPLLHTQIDMEAREYRCQLCQKNITEPERLDALKHYQREDGHAGAPGFSLRWTALDSPFPVLVNAVPTPTLPALAMLKAAAEEKSAQGRHDLSKTLYHDHFTSPFIEPEVEGEISAEGLVRNSDRSTVDKRTVPAWARFLVLTQDVQGDRHYWLLVAHGDGDRWAIIDWGYEYLVPGGTERPPTPEDRRRAFNKIRDLSEEGWQVEGGDQRMRPVQRGIDGGYLPEEIAAWIQGEASWKFLRGVGRDTIKHATGGAEKTLPAEIRATKALQAVKPPGWRIYWWRVDGHHFRRAAHAALLRHADQPASGMVPRGLRANADILLHLSGEIWDEGKEGKAGFWREVRKRHDYLDCLVYSLALALLHRHAPDRRDDGGDVPEPEAPPPTPSGDQWIPHYTGDTW